MSHQKSKRQKRSYNDNVEIEESENGEYNAIYIPDMNDSGDSSFDSEFDTESDVELLYPNTFKEISNVSYRQVLDNYTENQTQLEPEHTYEWLDEEKKYNESLNNEILLFDRTKKILIKEKLKKTKRSTDPLLVCPTVSSAMSRATFMEIKSKLKIIE